MFTEIFMYRQHLDINYSLLIVKGHLSPYHTLCVPMCMKKFNEGKEYESQNALKGFWLVFVKLNTF